MTAKVPLLPTKFDDLGIVLGELRIEINAELAVGLVRRLELGIGADWYYFRHQLVERMVADECDETKRLVLLEGRPARPCEHPVHREGEIEPVGLNDAIERRDSILR